MKYKIIGTVVILVILVTLYVLFSASAPVTEEAPQEEVQPQ